MKFQPILIEKPWGSELIWAKTDTYVGKILLVNKGCSLSLQYHKMKDETLFIEEGKVLLQVDGAEIILEPKDSYHIKPGVVHRITAIETSRIFEASTSELDDVVRIEDDYGRI